LCSRQHIISSPFCAFHFAHSRFGSENTILSGVSFVVAWPPALYCCISTGLLLNLAATVTRRDKNLHPNIPRDTEEPNSKSTPKVHVVDRRNQPDWSFS
jgi:hypothetical protein